MARPVLAAVAASGLLVALAVPAPTMQLGSTSIGALPEESDVRRGFEVLNSEFSGGVVTTPIAVTAGDVTEPAVQGATDDLVAALDADPAYSEITVTPAPDGDLLIVEATTLLDPSTLEARDAVDRLRTEHIPSAFAGAGAEALVTGQPAGTADYVEIIMTRAPAIIGAVLGMSFVLLLLAFRSLVVPLKAIVMNLLSVGATYGLIVAVFQRGWAADFLGFQTADVIEAWVPLFLFTVLFGLSMDYHVFLLSRIKERHHLTGDNAGSVGFGLQVTGRIITGAALIMVAVFAGFATGDLAMFQQMGFGLAVAVVLDATVVRTVLVPATMALLGERNWYLPRWLAWLPEVHIEGTVSPAPVPAAIPVVVREPEQV
jgi:RND superfamily putative drug exporter